MKILSNIVNAILIIGVICYSFPAILFVLAVLWALIYDVLFILVDVFLWVGGLALLWYVFYRLYSEEKGIF